jgi:hypothetical protein
VAEKPTLVRVHRIDFGPTWVAWIAGLIDRAVAEIEP